MRLNLLQFFLYIAALGVILILFVTSSFEFKSKFLSFLYPKPNSFAADLGNIPSVDLKIIYNGEAYDGVLNVPPLKASYTLTWQVSDTAASCIGRVWGLSDMDETWKGEKDPAGGNFNTKILEKNNPYVYTIDCKNDNGDSLGDSVTINVGAQNTNTAPQLTDLKKVVAGQNLDINTPAVASVGDILQFSWSSINTKTPYSICLATGSWPTVYKDTAFNTILENFQLDKSQTFNYTIYCSNEGGYVQKAMSVVVK